MSNAQVGNVYQQIISDVIESSRVDFEEGGVDDQVLEELKQVWQNKLSSLRVATFPWDPKPEPTLQAVQPAIVQPPTLPSNAGNYHAMNTPPNGQIHSNMQQMPPMNNNANGPRIKAEPGMESPPVGMSQAPYQNPVLAMPNATTAQQRAAQHLQNNYGPRAAASINAIQGAAQQQTPGGQQNPQQMPIQQQMPTQQQQQARQMYIQQQQQQQAQAQAQRGGQMPQQQQQQRVPPNMTQDQYRQVMAAQAAQAQQKLQAQGQNPQSGQPNGQSTLKQAQTDGAGDEEECVGLVKQVNQNGEEIDMGRVEIDGLIRQKIEAMGQKMEGGGLMLPLKQASTASKRQRKVKKSVSGIAQHDGTDGDEDSPKPEIADEDAINSDLDDPDDGLNEEEDEDEGMGHIMLCMYDKVQRVKNKWKCVMKDGVLTVNGKEYVFHKAQGEYEW